MDNLDNIKRKIKALFNRTVENGATQAEAETCIALASKLMTDYAIEKYQLQDIAEMSCVFKEVTFKGRDSAITDICDYIARAFDCKFTYIRKAYTGRYFGFDIDAQVCEYLHKVILTALENDLEFYTTKSGQYKKLRSMGYSGQSLAHDFRMGFRDSIKLKLKEFKDQRINNIKLSTGTDLVLVKTETVNEEHKKAIPKLVINNHKCREPQSFAYDYGVVMAEKVELFQAVETVENQGVLE